MKIKVVINPVSGKKRMRRVTSATVEMLKQRGLIADDDVFYTKKETNEIPLEAMDGCDVLVVAGGDGTLHHVINNLKNHGLDMPIAYLPTGTMNDFGHSLSLPRTPKEFCDMLDNVHTKKVDLGQADDEYFHYVVAGGTLSKISYTTKQGAKNFFGKGAYYCAAVLNVFKLFKGSDIQIVSEEYSGPQRAMLFLVSNSPRVGGFKNILPGAAIDDGLLHVLIIRKCSLFKALKLFAGIKKGKHINNPNVLHFDTAQVTLIQQCDKETKMDIDGEKREISAQTTIKILPRALTMVVPAPNKNAQDEK